MVEITKKWFPPHMLRALKIIAKNLSFADMILELVDARIPLSSQNKDVFKITKGKRRIVIFNKADLAEEKETLKWMEYFKKNELAEVVMATDLKTISKKEILKKLKKIFRDELGGEKWFLKRALRLLIVGIPNVGKSTLINKLCGRRKAVVGDTPGVTKAEQLLKVDSSLFIIDTPGVLDKLDSVRSFFLKSIGSLKGSTYDESLLAENLLDYLLKYEREYFLKIEVPFDLEKINGDLFLEEYAKKRNFLIKGGWDKKRASSSFLRDFRKSRQKKSTIKCDRSIPVSELTLEKVSLINEVNEYFKLEGDPDYERVNTKE